MVPLMSRHLTRTCQCKMTLHTRYLRTSSLCKPSSDPIKFYESPLGFLKCFFATFTSHEAQAGLAATKSFFETGMGYFAEQTTKPQTLGYSLADSPAGLLAWVYEKLVSWTHSYPWTDDEGTGHSINYQLWFSPSSAN